MREMKVGFIGLGRMGQGMARNVLKAGFDLRVFTRTRSKIQAMEAEGAVGCDSLPHLTREVDVVLACLPDIPTGEEVFLGERGVVSASTPGQILVDHGTVDRATSRRIYEAARRRGAFFLDAPISGGPEGALAGTLAIMAGGDEQAFQKALPVFQAMGKTVVHMGPSGSGTVTKLINQLLVGAHVLSSCEALLLGTKAGVDPKRLVEVLKNSWGSSRMLERNAPYIINREFGPSAVPLHLMVKDMASLGRLAKELEVRLPAATAAERMYALAHEEGMALEDITALYLLLEQKQV
ncbi:MAG: NAD(P)-dependent oxidoreductase [Candidatus Methylomirabilia bacterium]